MEVESAVFLLHKLSANRNLPSVAVDFFLFALRLESKWEKV
jgi:hypothetical protein